MKLFMFSIGGDFRNANIELHDVRFSAGECAEDCYPDLRAQWWGEPASLHLDCWGELRQADGHDIVLRREPPAGGDRLFFVNLGGYDPDEFAELHRNVLLVAPDAATAKARALSTVQHWSLPHRDNLFAIEKAVDVASAVEGRGWYIHLVPAAATVAFSFTCTYVPIGE
ncbi:DUF1543 domain-containing protein [Pseudoxanthobacter sp.]|uniref:DUF1543 domain-containing protein n=1 Tax=Pseudoxanthobacter sp. TaxID=1925742 RepID=UPI002FE08666